MTNMKIMAKKHIPTIAPAGKPMIDFVIYPVGFQQNFSIKFETHEMLCEKWYYL